MKTIKARYSVTFEATLTMPDGFTTEQVKEEISNVTIPEDEVSKYVEDSFDVEVDENGNPVIDDE
jgi:formylmethanofuran dehydrogenase subunit C